MGDSSSSRGHQHGLQFPVLLIVLGLLLLLNELVPGWGIGKTWPVLLIVLGLFKLADLNRPPRPPEGPRV